MHGGMDGCTAPAVCSGDAALVLGCSALPPAARHRRALRAGTQGPGREHGGCFAFCGKKLLNSYPCCWLSTCGHPAAGTSGIAGRAAHRAAAGRVCSSGKHWQSRKVGMGGLTDTPQEQQSSLRGGGLTLSRNGQSSPGIFKPRVW